MLKLYLDTETTNLWLFGPNNPADGPGQPHVVEFAWTMVDGQDETSAHEYLIKPTPDWVMGEKALATHGITIEMCEAEGVPLVDVAAKLHADFLRADLIVAYGVQFDMKSARASFRRSGLPDLYETTKDKTFDVMKAATPFCKIPPTDRMIAARRGDQFKTPKLSEAAKILLGLDHTEKAHRALADVRMTMLIHKHLASTKQAIKPEPDFGPGRDPDTGFRPIEATDPKPDLGII